MIRLAVALLHLVLGLISLVGGVFFALQGVANAAWEQSFYTDVSMATATVLFSGVMVVGFGALHALSAVLWFIGMPIGGWALVFASMYLAFTLPLAAGLAIGLTGLLVFLDMLVQRHRARSRGDPPLD